MVVWRAEVGLTGDRSNGQPNSPTIVPAIPAFAIVAVVAVLLGVTYMLTTQHVWEDYFITFRHSRNAAMGDGLVFQPGERVHGFTSPLGVLLPMSFHWLLGNPNDFLPALNLFRLFGLSAMAAGVALSVWMLERSGVSHSAAILTGLVMCLDAKTVGFAVNGQEAGLMVGLTAWSLYLVVGHGPRGWVWLGVVWACLQWTRPDGFIFALATIAAGVAFPHENRGLLIRRIFKGILLALLLYSPWLIFCTLYYGSPIPHTIIAKSGLMPRPETLAGWWNVFVDRLSWILPPINCFLGGWPPLLIRLCRTLALAGLVVGFLVPSARGGLLARQANIAYLLVFAYFCIIPLAAWYLPPAVLLLVLTLGASASAGPVRTGWVLLVCFTLVVMTEENRLRIGHSLQNTLLIVGGIWLMLSALATRRQLSAVLLGVLTLGSGTVFIAATRQISVQQEVVETHHRRKIGEWLQENVPADETIFLECLGYIGYFSNGRILDFPGLASPRVVAALRAKSWTGTDFPIMRMAAVLPDLKPDWLVLRPHEWEHARSIPSVVDDYRLVREFNIKPRLDADYPDLPGLGYLLTDSHFLVFRRTKPAP